MKDLIKVLVVAVLGALMMNQFDRIVGIDSRQIGLTRFWFHNILEMVCGGVLMLPIMLAITRRK